METTNRGQENRYLESPYVIRDTGPREQMPFNIKNPIGGGFVFSKKSFFTKSFEPDRGEKDNVIKEAGSAEQEITTPFEI